MRTLPLRLSAVALVAAVVAGCAPANGIQPMPANVQRAAIGAGAGAVAAKAFDGNVGKGALAGAAVGALCGDIGLCQPAY